MAEIIQRSAKVLDVNLHPDAVKLVASRARSTPRIANRLLKRVRDFAQVNHPATPVTQPIACRADMLEIDPLGLDVIVKFTNHYGSVPAPVVFKPSRDYWRRY